MFVKKALYEYTLKTCGAIEIFEQKNSFISEFTRGNSIAALKLCLITILSG